MVIGDWIIKFPEGDIERIGNLEPRRDTLRKLNYLHS